MNKEIDELQRAIKDHETQAAPMREAFDRACKTRTELMQRMREYDAKRTELNTKLIKAVHLHVYGKEPDDFGRF